MLCFQITETGKIQYGSEQVQIADRIIIYLPNTLVLEQTAT